MTEATDTQATEQAPDQGPGLSLNDIAATVQIIDAVSARGAIRGEELVPVGTVRERFMAFLNHAKEQGQIDRVPGDPMPESPAPAPEQATEEASS
jgi:hypothetical protein